jgi:hypothetical protein
MVAIEHVPYACELAGELAEQAAFPEHRLEDPPQRLSDQEVIANQQSLHRIRPPGQNTLRQLRSAIGWSDSVHDHLQKPYA